MQLTKEIFIKLQSSVDFFKSFSSGELIALLKLAETETFEDGTVVFKEGTIGDKMYIILAGDVRISRPIGQKQEEVLVTLQPGACFGEMGVIDASPRSARATAEGTTVLMSVKERVLSEHNLLLAYKLYRNFAIMLAGRLRDTNDKMQQASEGDRTSSKQVKDLLKKRLEQGVSMEGTNFKGANLSEAFLNSANFKNAVFVNADFGKAKCTKTNFTNANMVNAKFNGTHFENANLDKADFSGATFENCHFDGCKMTGSTFTGADMKESLMEAMEDAGAKVKRDS